MASTDAKETAERQFDSKTYRPPPFDLMEDVRTIWSEWRKLQGLHQLPNGVSPPLKK